LLNHSEHRILDLNNIVENLSNLNLQFIWCFNDYDVENNLESLKQIYQLKNNLYIAYEPSDLIGGQYGSVIENKKQMLELLCTNFDSKRILLGAGIQSEEDFRILYQSNFAGALLSSIVMNDENPLERLKELYTFEKMYNSSCK
jgi:triosephosphate isomerase